MKQARATRLFHVEQFGAWPADLVPLDEKGNPRPRDRHSVAICFTWNKIRVRKSPTKVRLRGSRTYMKQDRKSTRLNSSHVDSSYIFSFPTRRSSDLMKQARATRLFHVEQFGAWPADLVPLDEKGNPRPRDRHSVAICFTWNKIRVRKSPTKVRLRGSRTYMK